MLGLSLSLRNQALTTPGSTRMERLPLDQNSYSRVISTCGARGKQDGPLGWGNGIRPRHYATVETWHAAAGFSRVRPLDPCQDL
jgi:hypothetical protein